MKDAEGFNAERGAAILNFQLLSWRAHLSRQGAAKVAGSARSRLGVKPVCGTPVRACIVVKRFGCATILSGERDLES